VSFFGARGPQARRLRAHLRRRARAHPAKRGALDRALGALCRPQAIVYTDTADFTVRTVRNGILHFLMVFDRLVRRAPAVVRRHGGAIVKVEGDSLMIRLPTPGAAARAVADLEALLARLNRGRPEDERLHFSYGIGYGDLLQVEGDLFGLEVNLASKLGEDLARPGEILLTPAAAAALSPALRRRVVPHRTVTIGGTRVAVRRLRLRAR